MKGRVTYTRPFAWRRTLHCFIVKIKLQITFYQNIFSASILASRFAFLKPKFDANNQPTYSVIVKKKKKARGGEPSHLESNVLASTHTYSQFTVTISQ